MQTITRFFSSLSNGFQKQSLFGKLFILLFGLFILCSFCLLFSVVLVSAINPPLPKLTSTVSPTFTSPTFNITSTPAPAFTQVVTPSITNTSPVVSTPGISPSPANTQMSGFELVSLTSPVFDGGYAKAAIKTAPGAACSISFITPAGDTSQDAGLTSQVANKNGICSWTWLIATGTEYGTGIVSITANGSSRSFEITVIVK